MTLFSPVRHRFRDGWLNFDCAAIKQGLPWPPYLQPRAYADIPNNNLTADQNCIQGRTVDKTEDVRNFWRFENSSGNAPSSAVTCTMSMITMDGVSEDEVYWNKCPCCFLVSTRERKKFPTITKLAYFIPGIQVSSATSERSFSHKGRVIQDRRTSKTQLTTVVFLKSVLPKQTRKLEIKYFILLLKSTVEFAELYYVQSLIFDSAWCSGNCNNW